MRWLSVIDANCPSLSPEALKVLYGRSPGLLSFPCLPTPFLGQWPEVWKTINSLQLRGQLRTYLSPAMAGHMHRIPF